MGVNNCDRKGCDHIMCDRLILEGRAYICGDCYQELLEFRSTWREQLTAAEIREAIEGFMDSPVGTHKTLTTEEMETEFRRLTNGDDS